MKQIYDERESLRDKIVASVKEKVSEFEANFGEAPDGFAEAFVDLKYYRKDAEECFDRLENNLNLQRRLENIVLWAAIYDNIKNGMSF